MERKRIAYLIGSVSLLLILVAGAMALVKPTGTEDSGKLEVATTIYPLYDIANQVAGDRAVVHLILPPNSSPHTFDPTPFGLIRLQQVESIFKIGYLLDDWADKVLSVVPDAEVVTVDDGINILKTEESEHGTGEEVDANDEHACIHFKAGKDNQISLSKNEDSLPDLSRPHTKFVVSSTAEANKGLYEVKEAGDFIFYTNEETSIGLKTAEGKEVRSSTGSQEVPDCVLASSKQEFSLEPGQYVAEFPSESKFVLVIERKESGEGGHDGHDHEGHAHLHGEFDPHYWLSPDNAVIIANNISKELKDLDPGNADYYNQNVAKFAEDIKKKSEEWKKQLDGLSSNKIITFHGAFYYFANYFGLDVVASFEPFPGKEPTPRYIKELQEKIKQHNVKHIFSEPQLPISSVQTFSDDNDILLGVLDPVGGAEDRKSYFDLIDFNVKSVSESLRR